MIRILLAGIVGGVTAFVWGVLAWMVLPIHDGTMRPLPDEAAVTSALSHQKLSDGIYTYPGMPAGGPSNKDQWQDFTTKHTEGPIFTLFFHPQGETPMPPRMMLVGLAIDWVGATLAALLLASSHAWCRSYFRRVGFVFLLGLFSAVIADLALLNWMYFPVDHTVAMVVDKLICWLLVGLVLASIVKPTPATV